MSKDSNFTGQPVYNQVINLLDREKIMQISRETPCSEAYVKRFDGYQHLVVMLFGVLKHFDSLRELEIGMKAEAHKLHHIGLDYLVRRSTLAEANIRRPQIQTWVVLIANLLITVLSRSIKRNCAFSQVVTMIRLTLMYYINFIRFMENPDRTWDDLLAKETQKPPPEPT